jgi:hypothetical protein
MQIGEVMDHTIDDDEEEQTMDLAIDDDEGHKLDLAALTPEQQLYIRAWTPMRALEQLTAETGYTNITLSDVTDWKRVLEDRVEDAIRKALVEAKTKATLDGSIKHGTSLVINFRMIEMPLYLTSLFCNTRTHLDGT